jgi:hypothetical protein
VGPDRETGLEGEGRPGQPEQAAFALPRGYYYWDGRSLRLIEAAAEVNAEASGPSRFSATREKSSFAAAVETLVLCGGCSLIVAGLTASWDAGRFGGLAHALALFPILLIDPVYQRVGDGRVDLVASVQKLVAGWRHEAEAPSAWSGRPQVRKPGGPVGQPQPALSRASLERTVSPSAATTKNQPFWLRVVFYIALMTIVLEVVAALMYALGARDANLIGGLVMIYLLMTFVFGFVARGASWQHRLRTVIVIAALGMSLMALTDPAVAGIGHRRGVFPPLQHSNVAVDVFAYVMTILVLVSPPAMISALAGYGLSALRIRGRTRQDAELVGRREEV